MNALKGLKERYAEVRERLDQAARRAGRNPADILLVAVTKRAEPDQIRELLHLGHQDFAENRVQRLVQRSAMVEEYIDRLRTAPGVAAMHDAQTENVPQRVRWHMIGHLQRNKVKKTIAHSRLIHSVDSMRLAEEIQTIALQREDPVDILLQVNCSNETSKNGVAMPAAIHVADQINTMVNVRLRGLMTMGPLTDDIDRVRFTFERAFDCYEEVRKQGAGGENFDILSMGMSHDFELAIEYGANIVRIGTSLFGEPSSDEKGDESDDS